MRTIPIIQFGLGGVGRAVVEHVLRSRDEFEWRYGLRFSYVALCDSAGAAVEPRGLNFGDLQRALAAKAEGQSLADMDIGYRQDNLADIVDVAGVTHCIVIDATASDETVEALQQALDRGYAVVTANKKPLAGPYQVFQQLTENDRFRYEATVGAGVPVIATLRENLIASADTIHRIEGCMSGTLGYLTTGMQAGSAFSSLVREAKARGYTEPDPRQDLSGLDVARKALILARTLGWPLEMEQVQVESLYPREMEAGSVDEFLSGLTVLDADFQAALRVARSEDKTLRYVATLEGGEAHVGLQAVPLDSPIGRLQGTDNLIAFYTDVYGPAPLVLQGRGAGAHGTAAGVLADMVALARS